MRIFEAHISFAVSGGDQVTESDVVSWLLKHLRDFPVDVVRIQVDEQRNPAVWVPRVWSPPTPTKPLSNEELGKAIFDQTFKKAEPSAELAELVQPAKPKEEKWPLPPMPAGIGCTCQVLHMVIPPEGMTIHCPVHGDVFVRGSDISCCDSSGGKHD